MKFIQFVGKFSTSSKRFCKSGIDFALVAAPLPAPAPVVADDADEAAADTDEPSCCCCWC